MNNNFVEIERKFLLKHFPTNLLLVKEVICQQAYLSVDPEVRIRKEEVDYGDLRYIKHFITVKSDGNMIRKEVEIEISAEEFSALLDMISHIYITKHVKVFELPNGLKLECSQVDKGMDTEFLYAEVEFHDENAAEKFEMLPEFVKEVTADSSYKMKNYWKRTRL